MRCNLAQSSQEPLKRIVLLLAWDCVNLKVSLTGNRADGEYLGDGRQLARSALYGDLLNVRDKDANLKFVLQFVAAGRTRLCCVTLINQFKLSLE